MMGIIAALIGLDAPTLVAEARRLLSEGELQAARIAAMLAAGRGGDCPFQEDWLRHAWAARRVPPVDVTWAPRPGSNRVARMMPDEPGLDL